MLLLLRVVTEHFLLYESETTHGSSGGPILKATKGGLEIVGLHRGGYEGHYNYGSKFTEILLSLSGKKDHDKQSIESLSSRFKCIMYMP